MSERSKVAAPFHPAEDSSATADIVVPFLMERFEPGTVLDLGCNVGKWVDAFRQHGCLAHGVDGPGFHADIEHDLRDPLNLQRQYDMVLCLETAEHLPEQYADTLVESAALHSDCIIWSAATPGQGGHAHVNEQPASYWVRKFQERGFIGVPLAEHLPVLPHDYYRANLWAFER
jgi:hypothetical protein